MNSAIIRSEWMGRIIDGKFVLLQWLGGSQWSGVFLTELQQTDQSQKAAIKLIPADVGDAADQLSRWDLTIPISHPHLMRLFDAGRCQIDGVPLLYAVTEYSEEILSQILPERPLTPTETKEMLGQVIDGLTYVHGKGLVHGHLKPSNILVVDDQLKLSSDNLHVTGKPAKRVSEMDVYDAPETATGSIFPSADIWSLGVTLVEALTGQPLAWNRSTHREPIMPESIPQPFSEIIRKCLRIDPTRRCTLSDVKAYLEPEGLLPDPAGIATVDEEPVKKSPGKLPMMALVAAVLVLFAVAAVLRMRSHPTEPSSPTETAQTAPSASTLPPPTPVPATRIPNGATVKGAVAEQVQPVVLPSARESIEGHVNLKIRVTVDADGHVSDATFDSPGPSRYFAKVALQAAQQWTFKPAQVGGQPVSSIWILQYEFSQAATTVNPIEVAP